jgi:hypothetical protein
LSLTEESFVFVQNQLSQPALNDSFLINERRIPAKKALLAISYWYRKDHSFIDLDYLQFVTL